MQMQHLCKKAHYKKIEQLKRRIERHSRHADAWHDSFINNLKKSLDAYSQKEHDDYKARAKVFLNWCIDDRQIVKKLKAEMYLQTHFYEV